MIGNGGSLHSEWQVIWSIFIAWFKKYKWCPALVKYGSGYVEDKISMDLLMVVLLVIENIILVLMMVLMSTRCGLNQLYLRWELMEYIIINGEIYLIAMIQLSEWIMFGYFIGFAMEYIFVYMINKENKLKIIVVVLCLSMNVFICYFY